MVWQVPKMAEHVEWNNVVKYDCGLRDWKYIDKEDR
jgi:hypothetical protein